MIMVGGACTDRIVKDQSREMLVESNDKKDITSLQFVMQHLTEPRHETTKQTESTVTSHIRDAETCVWKCGLRDLP